MRRPRMTTRRWMIAVAVVALLMGIGAEVSRERRLADQYRGWADWYRLAEELNGGERVTFPGGAILGRSAGSPGLAAYYEVLRRKYERAASCPWLPVEPDPPLPDLYAR